ncbi:DUF2083 domain-containing protein [Alphaproteobacteria bacterium]|nr:DUF2083 domain-containing protein [Alphaproteobacteria bacterium]
MAQVLGVTITERKPNDIWLPNYPNPADLRFNYYKLLELAQQNSNGIGKPADAVQLKFSKDICYADSNLNIKSPTLTPIGLGCQVCERQNYQHRGRPPRGHKLRFDLTRRRSGLFDSTH